MKRTRSKLLAVAVPVSIACIFSASSARADGQEAADIAAARALGVEGVRLADAGNCVEAEDKLARAEKIHHAPTTLERLGECLISRGKLVEGTETLVKVVREVLPPNAPPAFTAAQDRAKQLLDQTKPKIGRAKITVKGLDGNVTPVVKVDDVPINAALLDTDRPTDPGDHKVDVSADGYLAEKATFSLKEGGSESVTVTLKKDPNYVPPPVAPPPTATNTQTTTPPQSPPPPPSRNWTPVIVAGGIGVVGLGLWGGFGLAAIGQKNDLDNACKAQVCPANKQSDIDSAKTNATIASVGLGVGAAGIVAAGVLFFVTTPSASAEKTTAKTSLTPLVGPGSVGLAGTF